jgi:hypothetical protein
MIIQGTQVMMHSLSGRGSDMPEAAQGQLSRLSLLTQHEVSYRLCRDLFGES